MEIGKAVTKRLVEDKEHLTVKLANLDTHTQIDSFGQVAWRAYILELVPENIAVRPFKTRMYLADKTDASFENIGDPFLAMIERFNDFAAERYHKERYDITELVGSTFVVEVNYHKGSSLIYVNLLKINSMPALENNDNNGHGLGFLEDEHE